MGIIANLLGFIIYSFYSSSYHGGGWKITPWNLIVQMFGLLPNLNWFAWYVYFYIFCMLIMPLICKAKVFRFKPKFNFVILLVVPYVLGIALRILPIYETNTLIKDLASCFLYFSCFLVGYWMAENKVIEKSKDLKGAHNPLLNVLGIVGVFVVRVLIKSIAGFLLDVFYAPILICLFVNLFEMITCKSFLLVLNILGKYSTGIWFFHAVFFSTYVSEWFQPVLKLVSWPPFMFVWLVLLSLVGAVVYQKVLDGLHASISFVKRKFRQFSC